MPDPGTSRYGIPVAPHGLGILQELLNTVSVGVPALSADLLQSVESARAWADEIRPDADTSGEPLTPRELERLRELREALRTAIHRRDGRTGEPTEFRSSVPLELDPHGFVSGSGTDLVGEVLLETYAAQARGDWSRVKLCAREECDLAFFDRTKNSSARFHSSSCANTVNLRNSRARRTTGR